MCSSTPTDSETFPPTSHTSQTDALWSLSGTYAAFRALPDPLNVEEMLKLQALGESGTVDFQIKATEIKGFAYVGK